MYTTSNNFNIEPDTINIADIPKEIFDKVHDVYYDDFIPHWKYLIYVNKVKELVLKRDKIDLTDYTIIGIDQDQIIFEHNRLELERNPRRIKVLTGHLYYGSAIETYSSCGNCDGACCRGNLPIGFHSLRNTHYTQYDKVSEAKQVVEEIKKPMQKVPQLVVPIELYGKVRNAFYEYWSNKENQDYIKTYFQLVKEIEKFALDNEGLDLSEYEPCDFADKTIFYMRKTQ